MVHVTNLQLPGKVVAQGGQKAQIFFAALGSANALPGNITCRRRTPNSDRGKQAWTRAAAIFQVLRLLGGGYKAGLFFTIFQHPG
jgi:hypothetical protein